MLIYLAVIDSPEGKIKFEIIYEQYKNLMFYTANKILGDTRDSEDIVHDAFLKIIEIIDNIDDPKCPQTRSLIVTITENKAIDLYRRRQSKAVVSFEEEYIGVPDQSVIEQIEDGELLSNVNDNENIDYIKIEYQDDGYYEFSASYEQLPSNTVSISLPEYANMNPTVQTVGESSLSASAVSTIITPTNIMDAAQLAERNDY